MTHVGFLVWLGIREIVGPSAWPMLVVLALPFPLWFTTRIELTDHDLRAGHLWSSPAALRAEVVGAQDTRIRLVDEAG